MVVGSPDCFAFEHYALSDIYNPSCRNRKLSKACREMLRVIGGHVGRV